jgi:competence protein ComEC
MALKAVWPTKMGIRLWTALTAEQEQWVLWVPVCLGTGIGLYFFWPTEPAIWAAILVLVLACVAAVLLRKHPKRAVFFLVVALVSIGFSLAAFRTSTLVAPVIEKRFGPTLIEGRITALEKMPKKQRVTLDNLAIPRLEKVPLKLRLTLRGDQPPLKVGGYISLRAIVVPPPSPAAPNAFDFQRQSFFRQLGGVGFALGKADPIPGKSDEESGFTLKIERLRQKIHDRVLSVIEGPSAGITAALMTGNRSAILPDLMAAVRDSGIAHLLAISGLHIGLVSGILFFAVRGIFALISPLALQYPIKKWAAAIAIPGALGYALMTGWTVPTQRAFLMVFLVLLAVLADRRGISMRIVAWAATLILIFRPESLLGASFQMSFSAVIALVAAYEAMRRRRLEKAASKRMNRIVLYLSGVAMTTLIAGAATAPFALFHFNRIAVFGLAANLVAVPIAALWIMPCAVLAYLLMPVGLDGWALSLMAWGVEWVILVAEGVAAWPGAVNLIPAMPVWGIALVSFGGLWLCLWQRRWRRWGGVAVAAGMASIILTKAPDVLIDEKGKLVAVQTKEGGLSFSSPRGSRFSRDVWLRRSGVKEAAMVWPKAGATPMEGLSCDLLGCIYRTKGRVVALVREEGALAEDCASAHVVISKVPVRIACSTPEVVIDRFDLWRQGGHALWLDEDSILVESVNQERGRRPWVIAPPAREPKKSAKN